MSVLVNFLDLVQARDAVRGYKDRMEKLHKTLPETNLDPVNATFAFSEFVSELYHGCQDPRWLTAREKLHFGFARQSPEEHLGNSSPSMAFAYQINQIQGFTQPQVLIIDQGTGGPKYQLYDWRDGCLGIVSEYKPGKQGCSLNDSYLPFQATKTLEDLRTALIADLKEVVKRMPIYDLTKMKFYVFITGSLRYFWEFCSSETRFALDAEMKHIFQPACIEGHRVDFESCIPSSFFLSQEYEASMQLLAATVFYQQWSRKHPLPPKAQVIGSFGIGAGSTQFAFHLWRRDFHTLLPNAGMRIPASLDDAPKTLLTLLREPVKHYAQFNTYFEALLDAISCCELPVIALTAGPLLEFRQENYYQAFLRYGPRAFYDCMPCPENIILPSLVALHPTLTPHSPSEQKQPVEQDVVGRILKQTKNVEQLLQDLRELQTWKESTTHKKQKQETDRNQLWQQRLKKCNEEWEARLKQQKEEHRREWEECEKDVEKRYEAKWANLQAKEKELQIWETALCRREDNQVRLRTSQESILFDH